MKTALVLLFLCGLALSLAMPSSYSESGDGKKIKFRFQYAAPFACGTVEGSDARLINGDYATTIMIHNPEEKDKANIRKKVALTFPASGKNTDADAQKPGAVSKFLTQSIGADEALEVDCAEIFGEGKERSEFFGQNANAFGKQNYAQGYLVIESDVSLDVDRVITAGNTETKEVEVEQEEEHHKKRMPNRYESDQESRTSGDGKKKEEHKKKQPKMMTVSNQMVASIDVDEVRERKLKK